MNSCTVFTEWTFRFMNVFASLIQLKVVHSRQGDYCANQLGVLKVEAQWLHAIIGLTLLKVLVFGCW